MISTKFKLGDEVILTNSGNSDLEEGAKYEIVGIDPVTPEAAYAIDDWYWFSESDLRLSSSNNETVRGGVLLEAKQLIEGDRNFTYGEPTQNFTNIAGMWNILFAHKLKEPLTPADVAQAMIALKQCRMITEQTKRDSWVDLAGYAAIGYEAAIAD